MLNVSNQMLPVSRQILYVISICMLYSHQNVFPEVNFSRILCMFEMIYVIYVVENEKYFIENKRGLKINSCFRFVSQVLKNRL